MLSRLINGLIAGLIAWSVTHSKWIALVVFGATAGLSSNKFKWAEEIVKTIKEEAGKAKDHHQHQAISKKYPACNRRRRKLPRV